MAKKVKVYTFKGKEKGVKYSIPHVTLKEAKIRGNHKWGNDFLKSTGKINKNLTKKYNR